MRRFLIFSALVFCLFPSFIAKADAPSREIIEKVGIDQKLGGQVPLNLEFRDEYGKTVHLADYFGSKPVILNLVYYQCPMLCTFVLNGLEKALKPLSFSVGREFNVVTVSFNPKETPVLASEKKQTYMKLYSRPGAEDGWHFLTGREDAIRQLAQSVGFRYTYDTASGQYAHAGGVMVLTPQGKIAQYFYGIEYSSKDLRFAMIEASSAKIGTLVDQFLLLCFHYDPMTGKYGFWIMNILRLASLAAFGVLAGFIAIMLRREHTKTVVSGRDD